VDPAGTQRADVRCTPDEAGLVVLAHRTAG
jgi:hypothetical protein